MRHPYPWRTLRSWFNTDIRYFLCPSNYRQFAVMARARTGGPHNMSRFWAWVESMQGWTGNGEFRLWVGKDGS